MAREGEAREPRTPTRREFIFRPSRHDLRSIIEWGMGPPRASQPFMHLKLGPVQENLLGDDGRYHPDEGLIIIIIVITIIMKIPFAMMAAITPMKA